MIEEDNRAVAAREAELRSQVEAGGLDPADEILPADLLACDEVTGAERYLAGRLEDPEYAAAYREASERG